MNPSPITSLKVQPANLQMDYVGDQANLVVFGIFSDGSSSEVTESSAVQYSAAAPNIAAISTTGVVTAMGPGTTNVLVTAGAVTVTVPVSVPQVVRGDLNSDGRIDTDDLNILDSALNTPANGPNDARDLNHDGVINALDARILTTLCTYPRCATHQ